MMAPRVLFADEIVQITEFKRHAKTYADLARRRPITIAQGPIADLTLASREMVGRVLHAQQHLTGLVELLQNQLVGSPVQTMGWADRLSEDDLRAFVTEYSEALLNALRSDTDGAWSAVEELLEDWKATADAIESVELRDALKRRERARKS